ncbi:MAG: alpha/beta fold hydrolase [Actinomycetota bacterium]
MTEDVRRYRLRHRTRPVDVWVAGDGPPLLLLHGWGLSGRAYRSTLTALAALGWRVCAPTLTVAYHWSIEQAADMAAEAMAGVDAEPAPVVGHSFGGAIGAELAVDHSEFVTALVAADSPLVSLGGLRIGKIVMPGGHYRLANLPAAGALLRAATTPGGLPSLLRSARWFVGVGQERTLRRLAEMGLPRAVVWAADDSLLPLAVGTRSAELLECKLIVIREGNGWPGAHPPNHDWPFSEPAHFAQTVSDTLRGLLGKAGVPKKQPRIKERDS